MAGDLGTQINASQMSRTSWRYLRARNTGRPVMGQSGVGAGHRGAEDRTDLRGLSMRAGTWGTRLYPAGATKGRRVAGLLWTRDGGHEEVVAGEGDVRVGGPTGSGADGCGTARRSRDGKSPSSTTRTGSHVRTAGSACPPSLRTQQRATLCYWRMNERVGASGGSA